MITGGATIADGALVLDGEHITWVGPRAELPSVYDGSARADYGAASIVPGLIDGHVHLGFDGGPDPVGRMKAEDDNQQLLLMLRSARELLGVGVTTARDLGARSYLDVVVRESIAAGLARGPRLLTAGPPITPTGGHCWFMGGEADSVDDVRRQVRLNHKHGTGWIKVMSTGGFMTKGSAPWIAQFTAEQLVAIVDEAGRLGKRVAAHAHGVEGIRHAVAAGVTTLEHCSFVDASRKPCYDAALTADIASAGIFVCPTISANAAAASSYLGYPIGADLPAMKAAGVRLIAGTDAGIDNLPHHQFVGSLEYLVGLGFSTDEVLAMATTEAADALGVGELTGRLAAGFAADLLVVNGDPLADIGALRGVVAAGRNYVPDSGRFDADAAGLPPWVPPVNAR